jgi:hypothetical protein
MPGLTPGEEAVMIRHDLGLSPGDIASELKISPARARVIIQTYDDDPQQDVRREEAIRRKTRRFGHLIKLAGGHR